MQIKRSAAVLAVAMAAVVAGCGSSPEGGGGGGGGNAGDQEGLEVAYISPIASQPGQQEINLGLDRGSEEVGWENSVLDANLSPDRQVASIDTAITQGRAAIASWTLDPGAAAGAYTRAQGEGIPVIGMNSEGEGVNATVWWEISTCESGGPAERNAELIQEAKGEGAKVVVLGGPPAPSIQAMVECFSEAAEAAGLEIVAQADNTNDNADAAQRIMQDLLTKNRDIDAVWAYNDATALGASAAITGADQEIARASAAEDGIIVIGNNGDADARTAVQDGRQTVTWGTDNVASGMAAVAQMRTALDGGTDDTYPALTVRSEMLTDETIGDYVPAEDREYTLEDLPLVD